MAIHKLKDTFLRSSRCSTTKTHARFGDGGNLYLDVTRSGAKAWMFVWFDGLTGKQRERGLGAYPTVSLDAARDLALDCRRAVAKGDEPMGTKIAPATFGDMFRLTIKQQSPSWKLKNGVYGQQVDWESKMANHFPHLENVAVAKITETAVDAVVAPLWNGGKYDLAKRIRVILNMVMQTAISHGKYVGANPAATETVTGKLDKKAKTAQAKQPSLAYAKVPAAIATLLATGRMDAKASVFCTLTATRSDETRLMRWSEINWQAGLWVIPAERMKVINENDQGGAHTVPLSDAAVALLRSITPVVGNDYVFAGQKAGEPIGKGALNVTIAGTKRKGGILFLQGEATQHGMRASFRTWGKEAAAPAIERDVLELCLAHKVGETDTERSYDRAEMIPQRRAALQAWGEYCRPAAKLALVA